MDLTTQQRFQPVLEQRLLEADQNFAPANPLAHNHLRLRLEAALVRIERGLYGRCVRCCRDLPLARLNQEPEAVYCLPCQDRLANHAPRPRAFHR